jgi:hypothetical protein
MCCILCEEPVRSVTFGLAAMGIVAIVNGTRKVLVRGAEAERTQRAPAEAPATAVANGDVAS